MPVDFSSLLADTLSNRGYEVEDASPVEGASGASYPVSMVAHREGKRFLVDALASRTVRDEDVQAVASIVDDAGLDGAIVLALEGEDHSASGPGADRVEIWSREHVEQAVGALVVDGHLEAGTEADDIGPSPIDPYAASEPTEPTEPANGASDVDEAEPKVSPPQAAAGPAPSPNEQETSDPDPTPEPQTDQAPDPTSDPQAEPGAVAASPGPHAEPEREPAPTADADDATEDPAPGADEDINHRDLVDPEDMLERAEQLMQEGAVDDGDAEIIVEDDHPEPAPQSASEPEAASQQQADPSSDPSTETSPDDPEDVEIDPGSDAEILEPGDGTNSQRPQPDGEPPEPETATTARKTVRSEPAAGTDEDPSPNGETSPAAAAGPGRQDEAFVSGATIEPKVDETEAILTAEEAVFEAEAARLELLPFRVYRYHAQLEGDGHSREEEGRVWVSTQSGAVVHAPSGDRVDEPEIAHERFQGALNSAQTEKAAREHLLDTLERRDEIRQDYSESAVIERVRLAPDPETLTVEALGKAHAPRWRIQGRNGTVFVDAVTGKLVTE